MLKPGAYLGEFPGVPETPKILACYRNNHRLSSCDLSRYETSSDNKLYCVWQHKYMQGEWVQDKGTLYEDRNTLIEQSAVSQTILIKHLKLHLVTPFKKSWIHPCKPS